MSLIRQDLSIDLRFGNEKMMNVYKKNEMIPDSTIIEFVYNRSDLEKIYLKEKEEKRFVPKGLGWQKITFNSFLVLFIFNLIYANYNHELSWTLFVSGLLLFFSYNEWYNIAKPKIERREELAVYFDGLEKIKRFAIVMTPVAFSFIQDENEDVIKWSEFTKASLRDDYIYISTPTNWYTFPRGSMSPQEFDLLRLIISNAVRTIKQNEEEVNQ